MKEVDKEEHYYANNNRRNSVLFIRVFLTSSAAHIREMFFFIFFVGSSYSVHFCRRFHSTCRFIYLASIKRKVHGLAFTSPLRQPYQQKNTISFVWKRDRKLVAEEKNRSNSSLDARNIWLQFFSTEKINYIFVNIIKCMKVTASFLSLKNQVNVQQPLSRQANSLLFL